MVDHTISNDEAGTGAARPMAQVPHLFRAIVGQKPLLGGGRHSLQGIREIQIGRNPELVVTRKAGLLVLGVPDPRMSSRHAVITNNGGWSVADLGSTNGTFLHGGRLTTAPLPENGVLEIGSTIFVFRAHLPCDPSSPVDVEADALPSRRIGLATLMPAQEKAIQSLHEIAAAGVSILLLGPSGAGKEVTARAIHALSQRRGAFVPVNCGALPETLLESQLFGHMKGAFSGAVKDELGFVRASDGGTLFLDEIGDMPKTSQVALLRVLQEREVTPVGATRAQKVDLRVVAATHRPVDELEAAGFRSDLYARLAGYTHRLVPLRERIVDLGILVADLIGKNASDRAGSISLTSSLAAALMRYPWPLNVRELEQTLSVAALLAKDGVIDLAHAPETLRKPPRLDDADDDSAETTPRRVPFVLDEADIALKESLLTALRSHEGNVTHVAKAMGKTRMQIHRWMRRFDIDPTSFR